MISANEHKGKSTEWTEFLLIGGLKAAFYELADRRCFGGILRDALFFYTECEANESVDLSRSEAFKKHLSSVLHKYTVDDLL